MKVQDLMVRKVVTCSPETDLAEAAWTMWEGDCGALPVVSEQKVVGIITDRDISMTLAGQSRPAREVRVREVLSGRLQQVRPEDDCATALELMEEHQVRRLPVVDSEQRLQGIISLNDFIVDVDKVRGVSEDDISYLEVMGVLKAVSRHRLVPLAGAPREARPALRLLAGADEAAAQAASRRRPRETKAARR